MMDKSNVERENDPKKYMSNGKFDTVTFNKDFGIILKKQIAEAEAIEENKLNDYNAYYNSLAEEKERNKKYHSTINSLTFSKILVKWGDTIKNIFSDMIKGNYSFDEFLYIFIKDDRLIYLGMTMILIAMTGYVINQYLLEDNANNFIGDNNERSIHVTTNNYVSEIPKIKLDTDVNAIKAAEQLKKI